MAKARALDKRRVSIRNIRKITRTMELVSTAQFKQALNRTTTAAEYTKRIVSLVGNLARADLTMTHPLLEPHAATKSATLLVLTGNRGMCGGYNSAVLRLATARWQQMQDDFETTMLEVSGKRGIASFRFRQIEPDWATTKFEHKPNLGEVNAMATRYLEAYQLGALDRLEIAYTKFESIGRQQAVIETLLPMSELQSNGPVEGGWEFTSGTDYEFLPSAKSILEELVPTAFRAKLFKCLLDAAVSEQLARMVAMKAATENADSIINELTMTYNRARQGQITGEILEVISGAEALGD